MNNLYDILEVCLSEIEQGADVDTVLFHYPDLANELRPLLESAMQAKSIAVPALSQDVVKRNKAKLLQYAAELREQKSAPLARRIWSVPLRRALVTFAVVAMLFVSGTGLVSASSNTLPGDNLYPVKRTWEGFQLFFTFDAAKRGELEIEHENERLDELNELFAEGRTANVDFAGYVTRQSGKEWRVSGITVLISSKTNLPDQTVDVGAAVRVKGKIEGNNIILAKDIVLLPPGSKLPEVEDNELEGEQGDSEGANQQSNQNPAVTSKNETPAPLVITTSTPEYNPKDVSIEGIVAFIEDDFLVVDGIVMDIQFAEVKGKPSVGAFVITEGYYDSNGIFVVIKIEFVSSNSGDSIAPTNNNDDGNSTNTNDHENENENDNKNDNDNNANSH